MDKSNNFRQMSEELEEIIDKLQSSDLDVDQIIKEYEKGTEVIDKLEKYLSDAQNKINKLKTSKK